MDSITDFEDILALLNEHGARYLIVGGMAFIYHAKPRYTKDIDIWIDPADDNVARVNQALIEFPSPHLLTPGKQDEILQIGVEPNRIDILRRLGDAQFASAWTRRVSDRYGAVQTHWIDLDTLVEIKSAIDHPRHQEDARVLKEVQRGVKAGARASPS